MIAEIMRKIMSQQALTDDERNELVYWFERAENVPSQVDTLFKGASQISNVAQITNGVLGIMVSGKFIAIAPGVSVFDPTDVGFTGSFMSGSGETFGGNVYNIGGAAGGVLQWGANQTDGKLTAGAGGVKLDSTGIVLANTSGKIHFKDSGGSVTAAYIIIDVNENLILYNDTIGAAIRFYINLTDDTTPLLTWKEDPGNTNAAQLDVGVATSGSKISIGSEVVIWAGAAGKTTIFNETGRDADFRIEGDTDANLLFLDASTDRVGIGTATPGYKLDVNGDINIASGSTLKIDGTTVLAGAAGAETNANDIFRCDSPGGTSAFAGTIATLPGGATLTYNVTTGTEGAMVPVSTSQVGKLRLYNTTRGTSALISNCVTGTNTITLTANVPAGWVLTDVITIASQTVTGSGQPMVDIEITSGGLLGKTNAFLGFLVISATVGDRFTLHPFETFSASKYKNVFAQVANLTSETGRLLKLTANVFSLFWTGTPTTVLVREDGYLS
jgi:hypothetical protein